MKPYQEELARLLAESGSLFFAEGLRLKDGRPTPYFVNLGAFRTGHLAAALGACFADWLVDLELAERVDILLGPSYKGSAIAQGAAMALYQRHGIDLAFDYDRKEAKTHGEASGGGSLFVTGALASGGRVLIIDDVGTSMATKLELLQKLDDQRAAGLEVELAGVALAVDRQQTQAVYDDDGRVIEGRRGEDALAAFTQKTGLPVFAMLGMRQAVDYLAQAGLPVLVDGRPRPLGPAEVKQMHEYLAIYGREA